RAGDLAVRGVRDRRLARTWALVLLGPLVVRGPLAVPYLRLARSEGLAAGIVGIQPDLLRTLLPRMTPLLWRYVPPGLLPLAAAGIAAGVASRSTAADRARLAGLALAVAAGVVLALGPGASGIRWLDPYRWLAATVPGFVGLGA